MREEDRYYVYRRPVHSLVAYNPRERRRLELRLTGSEEIIARTLKWVDRIVAALDPPRRGLVTSTAYDMARLVIERGPRLLSPEVRALLAVYLAVRRLGLPIPYSDIRSAAEAVFDEDSRFIVRQTWRAAQLIAKSEGISVIAPPPTKSVLAHILSKAAEAGEEAANLVAATYRSALAAGEEAAVGAAAVAAGSLCLPLDSNVKRLASRYVRLAAGTLRFILVPSNGVPRRRQYVAGGALEVRVRCSACGAEWSSGLQSLAGGVTCPKCGARNLVVGGAELITSNGQPYNAGVAGARSSSPGASPTKAPV